MKQTSMYTMLNSSDDLHKATAALAESSKEVSAPSGEARQGIGWISRALSTLTRQASMLLFQRVVEQMGRPLFTLAKNAPMLRCQEIVARGLERHSGQELTVRYVGAKWNFHYLLKLAFDSYETVQARHLPTPLHAVAAFEPGRRGEDCLFVDTRSLVGERLVRRPHLRLPAWVRQRLPLAREWPAVVDNLPRFTRRGVSRYLRKYGFTGRVAWSDDSIADFYHRLYVPYVRKRHQEEAVVTSETRFRRLARGCRLVEVLHEGDVIGANLVRRVGDSMFILWCGASDLTYERDLKGATDVLDYFSILHAFESGCTDVDFGRSRPTLNDGVMMYKSKWRARVIPARPPQAHIIMVPTRWAPAVTSMLAHNHFVTAAPGRLSSRILLDGPPPGKKGIEDLIETYCPPGLSTVRVFSTSGFEHGAEPVDRGLERVELVDLRAVGDPLAAYLGG